MKARIACSNSDEEESDQEVMKLQATRVAPQEEEGEAKDDKEDGKSEKVSSNTLVPIILGSLIAAVGYAVMVTWYFVAQQQLRHKIKQTDAYYAKLLQANEKLSKGQGGTSETCASLIESLAPSAQEGEGEGEKGIPIVSILIILSGCLALGAFVYREYSYVMEKMSSSKSRDFTLGDVIGYRLDCHFSSSKLAKPALLFAVTFVLILLSTVGFMATGEDVSSAMWRSWTYVADAGSHADAEGLAVRVVALATTMGGMCVFALMIGIISDFIGEKVDDLKKGKSRVIESRHTLMLGWSDMSLAIIQQIALANESEGGGVIVVLAKNDKEAMEAELEAAIDAKEGGLQLKGTEVIFRSGSTLVEHELEKVSVEQARAIIALSDGDDPDEADSRMVRQVLSLKSILGRCNTEAHVVCELRDVDNRHLVEMVGQGLVEVVCPHDVIGRLMIQCARSSGLAHVLENLMGFDGDEFYLKEWEQLVGMRFGDIHCRFDDAVPIGIKHDNYVFLNPDDDMVIDAGDEILVLAEDDDSYECNDGSLPPPRVGDLPKVANKERRPEVLLFCGWRRDIADMIKDLDEQVPAKSELWLLNSVPVERRAELLLDKGNKEELCLENLVCVHAVGNHYSRRDLRMIQALDERNGKKIPGQTRTLHEFDSILILAESAGDDGVGPSDMETSDSRSLASLLLIRDLQKEYRTKSGMARNSSEDLLDSNVRKICQPISEILDSRTSALITDFHDVGYVLSNQIVSAAIAQIAECRDMNQVLGEMLRAEGNEVHVEPITLYIDTKLDISYSFWEVALLARKRQHDTPQGKMAEIAIGYKPFDVPWGSAEETLLNPPNKHEKRKWHAKDYLIVIAP